MEDPEPRVNRVPCDVVGWGRFELPTSASRTQRSAKLSHHPWWTVDSSGRAPVRTIRKPGTAGPGSRSRRPLSSRACPRRRSRSRTGSAARIAVAARRREKASSGFTTQPSAPERWARNTSAWRSRSISTGTSGRRSAPASWRRCEAGGDPAHVADLQVEDHQVRGGLRHRRRPPPGPDRTRTTLVLSSTRAASTSANTASASVAIRTSVMAARLATATDSGRKPSTAVTTLAERRTIAPWRTSARHRGGGIHRLHPVPSGR